MSVLRSRLRFPAASPAYSHSISRHDDHAALVHRFLVTLDELAHRHDLLRSRHCSETHNAGVRQLAHKHKFAKVLVFRDENALLCERHGKQFIICRAGRHFPG